MKTRSSKKSLSYLIIGSGHKECFRSGLGHCWSSEHFTNVTFHCKPSGFGGSYQVKANASVLAAASPFFAKLLSDFPLVEEDAVVLLPDYSRTAVFFALQYVYTGTVTVKSTDSQISEIQNLLEEFGIKSERKLKPDIEKKILLMQVEKNIPQKQAEISLNDDSESLDKAPETQETNESCLLPIKFKPKMRKHKISPGVGIDCNVMNPENVSMPPVLPNIINTEKNLLANDSDFAASTHTTSSGFSYQQCFSLETSHRSRVMIGNYEPSTNFKYDPSPQYLRQIPVKQYKRKMISTTSSPRQKMATMTGQGKVHVTLPGSVTLTEDSVFADPEDFGKQTKATINEPIKTVERLDIEEDLGVGDDEDYKAARKFLQEESKRRHELKRKITRLTNRIEKLRKRVASPPKEKEKKQKPKTKPPESSDVRVKCDVCGRTMKQDWLKHHLKSHEAHQYCCDKCGRTFAMAGQLRSHYRLQHVDLIAECGGFPCGECGRVFKLKRYLKKHMTLHTGEKPYACKYCNRTFRSEIVRRNHQRTHTGERPQKCHICDKRFNQRATLVAHLRMHEKNKAMTGVTPKGRPCFQCEYCPAQFFWENYLIAHTTKHTGETPILPCEHCPRVFTSLKELQKHRLESHASETFLCDVCGKQFLTKGSYYTHKRKHANNQRIPRDLKEQSQDSTSMIIEA